MLFISLVPNVSASNLEPQAVKLQNSVKELIRSDQKIQEPGNSTGQHIKRQIRKKMVFKNEVQNRKIDRIEQTKKQLRIKRHIQEKKSISKIKSYRNKTENFKAKARKEMTRNAKYRQQFNH